MTPFVAITFAVLTTELSLIVTVPSLLSMLIRILSPFNMRITWSFDKSFANTNPFATWYNKIFCSTSTYLGNNKQPSNVSPKRSNAWFVGAKTVNGPSLGGFDNGSTKPANVKAVTNVVNPNLSAVLGISSSSGNWQVSGSQYTGQVSVQINCGPWPSHNAAVHDSASHLH